MLVSHNPYDAHLTYFRADGPLEPEAVPAAAVARKELPAVDLEYVDYVLEITPEEYYEHMWE